MSRIKELFARVPAFVKNPFFITGTLFLVWMVFIDENNVVSQYRRWRQLKDLEEKKAFYKEQIEQTQKYLGELTTNPETQEKFAREHYWMKKDNEDVFVIVQEDKKP